MSASPTGPRPDPIAALPQQWRHGALVAGQYSVECAITKGHEHHAAAAEAMALAKCAEELAAALRADADARPPQDAIVAVIDGRCGCKDCVSRTENIYRMIGHCDNCGARLILMLFRAGDPAAQRDCPVCGKWHGVQSDRLATPDEIPAAVVPRRAEPPPEERLEAIRESRRELEAAAGVKDGREPLKET